MKTWNQENDWLEKLKMCEEAEKELLEYYKTIEKQREELFELLEKIENAKKVVQNDKHS